MRQPVQGSTRREFLGRAGRGVLAGTALSSCVSMRKTEAKRRPNVILLFSDEHRWHSMSFTEMPELHTPNMQRLASEGATFTHCVSSYPVCSPHRAMLMTGRWPHQQGVIDNGIPLRTDEMTLGKTFKAAGYETAYIGKWHLGGVRAEPFGFDRSLIWTEDNTHWDTSRFHPTNGQPVQPKGYNATLMTNQALDILKEPRDKPLFLMLSWNPPHSNFLDAPPEKKALYPEGSLPWRQNVPAQSPNTTAADNAIWNQNRWPHYQGYHAHISAIDDELGRIMHAIDAQSLAEDTILIYTADHGSMMGSHGLGGKRQPYEESIRVPFLIRHPSQIPPHATPNALFATPDIFPTLCGLAGLPIPSTCVGHDFSTTLLGEKGPDPEAQLLMHISKKNASGGEQHPAPLFRGLRTRQHTYAVKPEGPWLLFDNEEDPFQMANLINDPAKTGLRKDLDALLREMLKKADDPFFL